MSYKIQGEPIFADKLWNANLSRFVNGISSNLDLTQWLYKAQKFNISAVINNGLVRFAFS